MLPSNKCSMPNQRTIERTVSYSGTGLHTGNETTVTFKPAPPGSGVVFFRSDLPGMPSIKADIDNVVDVSRGTTLGTNGIKILTVEHLLAAVAGLEIDNLYVDIDANEPPVGDGSAQPFVEVLLEAGVVEQDAEREIYVVDEPLILRNGDVTLTVVPDDAFRISFTISFDHKAIGTQYGSFKISQDSFPEEVGGARTFCLLHEVELLQEQGLIKGGSLDNAVVVGDEGILNENLRCPDEFVRHKVLDLLGDLFLLGCPIRGHVVAIKSGHAANVAMTKKIRDRMREEARSSDQGVGSRTPITVFDDTSLNIEQIKRVLPHRYPFLLIDKVLSLVPGKTAVAIKNITVNEPYFEGHWPDYPVVPGVLLVEMMAQLAGLMLVQSSAPDHRAFFLGIDKARFRIPVRPGDQLQVEVEAVRFRTRTGKVRGRIFVGKTLVADADLLFSLMVPKDYDDLPVQHHGP